MNVWIGEIVVKGCCHGNRYIMANVVLGERVVYQ